MKQIFCILIIIFLYISVFVCENIKNDAKPAPTLQIASEEVKTPNNRTYSKRPKVKAYKEKTNIQTKNHAEAKITGGKIKIFPVKKVAYKESFKSGKVTLFISNPTLYNLPSNKPRQAGCTFLINEIKNAQKSVDFSAYEITGQKDFLNALLQSNSNGALVRGVVNSNNSGTPVYPDITGLQNKINIKYDFSKALMHNKFFIVDDKFVLTGSLNISSTGCGGYNGNIMILVEDNDIISAYKKEFNQMFSGKFKKAKQNFSLAPVQIDANTKMGVYFSPVGGIFENVIQKEIQNAKHTIRVSAFILTHKQIINELILAKKRGVNVKIILDAVGANNFKDRVSTLRNAGILVKVENFSGKNHEKTISVDGETLIAGSANFSYSGLLNNDENVVLLKNKQLSAFYNSYFDLLFNSIDNFYLKNTPRAEGVESGNSCYDGLDNNYDGKIDMEDAGCKINTL